jgi:hypothetical protein
MKIEVSIGEVIDKYSILEIKQKKISDANKLIEIKKEIVILQECLLYKTNYTFYYNLLMYVNEKIWDMTDIIKSFTVDNPEFGSLSNQIFEFNQKRFRIKNWFNLITDSTIKEQKSYASKHCKIIINSEEILYSKIAEINYLSLEYDIITFDSPYLYLLRNIFSCPTFIYEQNNYLPEPTFLYLENYNLLENKEIYDLPPVTYVAGGLFGDFIQSLSVINEIFYKTGRKGILYLSNKGDTFRNGLLNTYKDTYPVIINQNYIKDYKIYYNESYNINLTLWRKNPNLYKVNWYNLYKETYQVEWGKHSWLDAPIDEKWKDIILVNTTDYRWAFNIDFMLLNKQYPDKLIFIAADNIQYNHFIKTTSLKIPLYKFNDFQDLCIAIKSCKLFVGSLSAPLAIAHALNTDRIIGLCSPERKDDNILNTDLNILWNNVKYTV